MNSEPKPRTKVIVAFALLFSFSVLLFGSLAYGNATRTPQVVCIRIDGEPASVGPTIVAHLQSEAE